MKLGPGQPSGGLPKAGAPARWIRASSTPAASAAALVGRFGVILVVLMVWSLTATTFTTWGDAAPSQLRPAASA